MGGDLYHQEGLHFLQEAGMTAALRLQRLDLLDFVIKVGNDLLFANPATFSAAKVTLRSGHNI